VGWRITYVREPLFANTVTYEVSQPKIVYQRGAPVIEANTRTLLVEPAAGVGTGEHSQLKLSQPPADARSAWVMEHVSGDEEDTDGAGAASSLSQSRAVRLRPNRGGGYLALSPHVSSGKWLLQLAAASKATAWLVGPCKSSSQPGNGLEAVVM
jgi:hypothetical protein